ncbi:MAG: ethanolamine ammonia-lyase reactivating factor EutA, partial [Dehalococcoidia bacterium]
GAASLPAFGLQVVRPVINPEETIPDSISKALAKFDLSGFGPGVALALSLPGPLNYPNLRRLAEGVASTVRDSATGETPVFIVTDLDIAKSLGGILKEEFLADRELVVVDGIDVGDLDYLDLGRPMGVSEVVPVTVKSLVFPNAKQ